uniref:Helicase DDB-G0274399 n=1 Tax=Cajanus cajan TaxID=3821 RepID=A0A151S6H8_CAJCA|nr:putative helicase DDB-G0274399 [Cajanus cajan]
MSMANKLATRRELLDRWRGIEEEEENDDDDNVDPSKRRSLHLHKEQWFADAYIFLIFLPSGSHIWCGFWDIMGPLLETFYNYFKDDRQDSPLRLLWKRISDEMQQCLQCISQHHQAQDMYSMEYESSTIGPLLDVLQKLDYDRVTLHLRDINTKIAGEKYDPANDNAEVVNVLYEVLMFPILLDYQPLFTEFELFVEAIDNKHELALSGNQQFPVFSFSFACFDDASLNLGFLSLKIPKKVFIFILSKKHDYSFIEKDMEDRNQNFQMHVACVTAILPLMESWKRTSLLIFSSLCKYSFSLRDICLSKCRRATDLEPLQPLLKKFIGCLEADALPVALETSTPRTQLDRVSLWIGIKSLLGFLDPSTFEEGILERYPFLVDIVLNHISGDSLEFSHAVTCLRLLFEMLGCKLWLRSTLSPSAMRNTLIGQCFHTRNEKIHKDIFGLFQPFLQACMHDDLIFDPVLQSLEALQDGELEKQRRYFLYFLLHQVPVSSNFSILTRKLACQIALLVVQRGYKMNPPCPPFECAHMWGPALVSSLKDSSLHNSLRQPAFDLIQTIIVSDATALIYSVLNCRTTPSTDSGMANEVIELDDENDDIWLPNMVLPSRSFLSSYAAEISSSFGWKVPTGSDDGGDGNKSKNSVEVLTMSFPLLRTFIRLTEHVLVLIRQGELRCQWTWEPLMSESLILSLLDPHDDVRQFGKSILEQVSDTRGLSSGLKFLCSHNPSLYATILGLKHAMKLVQLDSVLLKFHTLHHFWFLLCKLLKDEGLLAPELTENTHSDLRMPKFSSKGGFLKQPAFNYLPENVKHAINVEQRTKETIGCLLCEMAWPIFCRCLINGKNFIDYNLCQMTCIRLLEILPVLVDKFHLSGDKMHGNFTMLVQNKLNFKWIHDLMEWGKSSLTVVIVYWKRAVTYILTQFKACCGKTSLSTIMTIENLLNNGYTLEELTEQVSHLSVSLSMEGSHNFQEPNAKSKLLVYERLRFDKSCFTSDIHSSSMEDIDMLNVDSKIMADKRSTESVIILSDDEVEPKVSFKKDFLSVTADLANQNVSVMKTSKKMKESIQKKASSSNLHDKSSTTSFVDAKGLGSCRKEVSSKSKAMVNLTQISDEADAADDPLEIALKSVGRVQLHVPKPTVLRRQVIQLKTPLENKSGYLRKLEDPVKRFRPPSLDDWYKAILEINYFATVGLSSMRKDENQIVNNLKQVPVYFQSPEQYMEIFQPLVLEEFKAQLHNSFLEMSSWEEMFYGILSVMSIERIDDFHLVRFVHDDGDSGKCRSFSENDFLLLTKEHPQKSSGDVHMVGKVERREKDNKRSSSIILIRFYFQNGSSRLNQARRNLTERSKWHACHLNNLCQSLQQTLRSSFNLSQLQAISVAIQRAKANKSVGLSLIQGPPGTGKTRTIVAIVSALLASQQKDAALARQLGDDMQNSSKSFGNFVRQRVLICAQSNAAVDELVARISSHGLYGSNGKMYKPYLVRVGNAKTVHQNSLPFFIDTLVDQLDSIRNKLRKSILKEAEIVVTTLSGCGGDLYGICSERMLNSKFGGPSEHTLFDAVVIDEAAQALEPATLIPLQLLKSSGTKCIMVGDPKQLPATVLSNVASKFLYECSMFERLQKAGHPVIMLTEQYRMHPEICKFPSLHFYDNKLLNGSQISNKSAPFHQTKGLGPYVFYDIIDGQEVRGKNSGVMSLCNEHEADAAVEVLKFFKKRFPAEFVGGRIGVITPYKSQLSLLRSRFLKAFGPLSIADIEFNTVDGFQGREVDILLLSTVRAAYSGITSEINSNSIGFVADVRRMNVALTRARLSLWIFGNARTLQSNQNWAALLKDAKERNLIMMSKMPYHSIFKTDKNKYLVENSDNHARLLKHEKKVKDIRDSNKEGKDQLNISMEKTTLGKRQLKFRHSRNNLDYPVEKTGGGHKASKLSVSERVTMHPGGNRSSSTEISASSKGCHKERDAVVQGTAPNQSKDAEISKRKQQREAVDAILYSSLISAKKDETLTRVSAKRPFSSSIAGGSTKPPKTKSGKLLLCLLILYDLSIFS